MRALILALGMLATSAAAAQDSVGGWTVEEIDIGCVAVAFFDRGGHPTSLSLGRTLDGRSSLMLMNEGWSTVDNKIYDVYLMIDDELLEGKAIGGASGTLTINLEPEVMKSIGRASQLVPALKIYENSETVLEAMNLKGSAAALARVDSCVADLAEAKRRSERFPADPFKP